MNVFHKITGKTMRENRTRTIVMIVGVALSAAMFTAITTFGTSLSEFLRHAYCYQKGDWHISVCNIGDTEVEQIARDEEVSQMAVAEYVGYADIGSVNENKPYLYLEAADDTFFDVMPVHLTMGELPQSPDEILLPEHLAYNGDVEYKVGDVLNLELGDRIRSGDRLNQSQEYAADETSEALDDLHSCSYTVCGFYERFDYAIEGFSAPGYTALTCRGGQNRRNLWYDVYAKLAHPSLETVSAFQERYDDVDGAEISANRELLMAAGVFGYSNISTVVFLLLLVFGGLTLFASVSLIYSAFSISVSERTRQFGLLSSVGATRRQIRSAVFYEGFLVSAAGIPCGIAVGLAGMYITLHLIGDRFISLMESDQGMRLSVTPLAILGAVLIAAVTVCISAWIPARRAMRVTAIEAIRQNREIAAKGKEVRVSKRFLRLFGLPGVLGRKYFLRSRRRYRGTILSLTFSVVLFISAGFFCRTLADSMNSSVIVENYDVSYYLKEMDEDLLEELRQTEGVSDLSCIAEDAERASLTREEIADSWQRVLEQDALERQEYIVGDILTGEPVLVSVHIDYLDEVSYAKLLREEGISDPAYTKGQSPKPLFFSRGTLLRWYEDGRKSFEVEYLKKDVNELTLVFYGADREGYDAYGLEWEPDGKGGGQYVSNYVKSDREEWVTDEDGEPVYDLSVPAQTEKLALGGRILARPAGISPFSDGLYLIYPYRALDGGEEYDTTIFFKADDYDVMMENIKQVLEKHGYSTSGNNFYSPLERERSDRGMITIVRVFSYGFIVMVTLIAIANVFHVISTGIALRRRDFAMLQSMGMTRRGIKKMLDYECLLYGLRALIWGIPLATVFTLGIFAITHEIVVRGYRFPWLTVGIAAVGVFASVWLTMAFALRRMGEINPVDELKE